MLFYSCSKIQDEFHALISFPQQFEFKKGFEIVSHISFLTDSLFQTSDSVTSNNPEKHYSQEEFKDIVAFCRQRHITFDLTENGVREVYGLKYSTEKL